MRGHPTDVTPTRRIKLDAWPPVNLVRRAEMGAGFVRDDRAMAEWDRLRNLVSGQWRGSELRRCSVLIVFRGARSEVEMAGMGSSVLTMLHRAAVIESRKPTCVQSLRIVAKRGPVEGVEIRLRPLVKPETGHKPPMSRGAMWRVLKRERWTYRALAEEIHVSHPMLVNWFAGRKQSQRVEESVLRVLQTARTVRLPLVTKRAASV